MHALNRAHEDTNKIEAANGAATWPMLSTRVDQLEAQPYTPLVKELQDRNTAHAEQPARKSQFLKPAAAAAATHIQESSALSAVHQPTSLL